MNISASMVKELREKTGAGMMDCKKALVETNGDMEKAIDYLREKGISKAAKKAERIAAEGLSNIYIKGNDAVVVELNSETDFVAKNAEFKELLDKNLINIYDASKILTFTFFSNPLFIINTAGVMFFNNKVFGFYILISHIIGNILTGLLFRNIYKTNNNTLTSSLKTSIKNFYYDINNTKIFKELLNGIKKSLNILINIFGIMTCFLIITKIITLKLNLSPFPSSILSGLLEMTTGLKSITSLNITEKAKLLLSTFFISFGGLSVHAQIFSMLDNYKINYYIFLISRLIHASLSVFICLFLYKL